MHGRILREDMRSRLLHRCLDIVLNWTALALAFAVKERFALGVPTEGLTPPVVIHSLTVITMIWLAVCSVLETYTYKRRPFGDIVNLLTALALTIAFFNTYMYFTRLFVVPRYAIILYAGFGAAMLAASRGIKYSLHRTMHRYGLGVRRVILVGEGPIARRLAANFRENHALGCRFLGFVSETPSPPDPAVAGHRLGILDDLQDIVRREQAEEVIVALPGHQHQEILAIAHRCQAENIRLRVVPDLFEVVMIRATLSDIDGIPLIGLRDPVINGYQSIIKRVFDLAVASFCLLLSLPMFLLIPVLIWLDDRGRGSVFFAQTRVGENGRPFRMYKFRTMVSDAEDRLHELVDVRTLSEPVFKIKDDPRVTRVGRFLRRTSLDELPQLINVLQGSMSMVGPRPEEVQVVEHYQLWHRKRLSIKPGITGPMQVAGRGELSLDDRIKLELLYITRYSLLEDVKYLLKTIPAVCRARGAY